MEFRRPGEYEPVTRTGGSQSAVPESWAPAPEDQLWTKSEKPSPEGSSSPGLANTTAKTTNEIWSTRRGHVLSFSEVEEARRFESALRERVRALVQNNEKELAIQVD
jgi:hypothetical protein